MTESWMLGALVTAFGMGKADRAADVEAWIVGGDEAARDRLAGRASKKQKDWYAIGLLGSEDTEATMAERGFQLAKTVLAPDALLAWITGQGSLGWVLAFHRDWQRTHGGPEVQTPPRGLLHDRRTAALAAMLGAVDVDDAMRATAFGALAKGSGPMVAWALLAKLGAEERSEGRTHRVVRRLGRVVSVEHRGKTTLEILADAAAADAFVAALAPADGHVAREWLGTVDGMVAIFLDAQLDPKGTLDGKGGPLGWIDHDDWETVAGTPAEALPQLSFAASFADAAIARATELGRTERARIQALYGRAMHGPPGQRAYGFYLGTFPYQSR